MKHIVTDEQTRLAYRDTGAGDARPLLLVHGFGCDHAFFARQQDAFSRDRRVVSVDLRGHGASDAPAGAYTPSVFVDDLALLCERLRLDRPVVVGHSLGGSIALELAAALPTAVSAVVMIDSLVFPPHGFTDSVRPLADLLHGSDDLHGLAMAYGLLFRPNDDPTVRATFAAAVSATPRHVLAACFDAFVMTYDASAAAAACRVPVVYIGSETPLGDTTRFKAFCPGLRVGQTVGAGHFSPLLVPNQINAMIGDVLADLGFAGG